MAIYVKQGMSRAAQPKPVLSPPPAALLPVIPLVPSSQTADEAWQQLAIRLAAALADLEEDDFLILSPKQGSARVQFTALGKFGMRLEATSNPHLDAGEKLSREAVELMHSYGWQAPTSAMRRGVRVPVLGSPNYFMDLDVPVPFEAIARLAAANLRDIYGVAHPGDLQYASFNMDHTRIRHPILGLKKKP